jgi:hypothetical protein
MTIRIDGVDVVGDAQGLRDRGRDPVDRLGDDALMVRLRDTIAAARCRPRLKPKLREYLADELGEMKAEMIAAAPVPPEDIVRIAYGTTDCQGERV